MTNPEKRPVWSTFSDEEWAIHLAAVKKPLQAPTSQQFKVIVKLKSGANFDGVQYLQDQIHLIDISGLDVTKLETWHGKIRLSFQIKNVKDIEKLKAQFKEKLMKLEIKEEKNIVSDVFFL